MSIKDTNQNKGQNREKTESSELLFLHEKIEKLSGVIFFITKSFLDFDPLRVELRKSALRYLSFIKDLDSSKAEMLSHAALALAEETRGLRTLLELCVVAGQLSRESLDLLKDEMRHLVQTAELLPTRSLIGPSRVMHGDPKKHKQSALGAVRHTPNSAPRDPSSSRPSMRSGGRKEEILARMAPSVEYTIREIAAGVSGYSEKTLQRELSLLVFAGILRKKGERRWSTYSRL